MLSVRPLNLHPDRTDGSSGSRFNVLLTRDRLRGSAHWTETLPRLLEPQGVSTHVAGDVEEALHLAERVTFHAAVIDISTPRGSTASGTTDAIGGNPGGIWLLQLLRRLPNRPPIVVVDQSPHSQKQVQRMLSEALRLGAFSVLNQPVDIEQLLLVFQRLVERQYQGLWPTPMEEPKPQTTSSFHVRITIRREPDKTK